MPEQEIYEKLIQWMNRAWFGLPDSDHLMPAIQDFFSPEEAELLTGMPFRSTAVEALAELKGMDPSQLAPKLDTLARRGVLWRSQRGDSTRYKINAGSCQACGLCEQRCPMEALSLQDNPEATNKKGKAPALRPERCLGCGVCVYKCPTQSLILERLETVRHPPKTVQDWMGRWLEDRKAGASGKGSL